MKKWNWDKILFSWPVMTLNACSLVFMLCVFGKSCAEDKQTAKAKADAKRRMEIQYLIKELKKDSL